MALLKSLVVILSFCAACFASSSKLNLSSEYINYLSNKKEITMCIDPNWMPYEKIQKGKNEGITADYMQIIKEKIGIPIRFIPTQTWTQSLEFAKMRKCDILSIATTTPSRLKYMNFTQAYVNSPIVISTKMDKLFISDIEDIINIHTLAVVKGYSSGEYLRNKYPNNKLIDVASTEEGIELVAKGKIFGFVGAMPSVAYVIQNKYMNELKIVGKLKENFELGTAVRKDEPLLLEIFNQAISSIDYSTKQKILNKYISVKFEKGFDYNLFWKVLFVLLVLSSYGVYKHNELITTKNKLENSIKNFEVLLNSTMEAIFVYENEICLDVNDVAVNMFGYESKDQMIGLRIDDFADQKTLKRVKENFSKNVTPYEVLATKKNGDIFNVLVQGTNTNINGRNVRISTAIDTTTMKNQEKILLQQSKMAAMGEMIDNIAHQWRQPLSLISTVSTGLELKLEFNTFKKDEALAELKNLNETTQHLSQTIDDFRNFFKSNKVQNDFSVLKLIRKNLTLFDGMFKNSRIDVIFENEEDIIITNYENELTQALLNIFYNARDAMDELKGDKFVFINLSKTENNIVIQIKDNGGGIHKDAITKIFEPYFTTKHNSQGTGIGLYMTHQIIEKNMKGSIEAANVLFTYQNVKYLGAQFTIKLPL